MEMEGYRLTANLKSSLSQKPTFQTSAPPCISLPPKTHRRDPPFPSYLRPEAPKRPPTTRDRLGGRADDTEISIFDAERYFNEVHDSQDSAKRKTIILEGATERYEPSANPRDSVSSVDGYRRNLRDGSSRATPTASSEASWNSRSGLLKNPPESVLVNVRAFPQCEQRKGSSSSGWWLFGRNCPCFGKKPVDIEEKYVEPKSPNRPNHDVIGSVSANTQAPKTGEEEHSQQPKSSRAEEKEKMEKILGIEELRKLKIVTVNPSKDQKVVNGSGLFSPENSLPPEIGCRIVNSSRPFTVGGGFSFPIVTPPAINFPEDPARDSLEVFRPAEEMTVSRKPAEFHRRMPAMQIPGGCELRSFNSRTADDDPASDTSSELFEIESFSTQMTYRRRDSLDELSQGALDSRRVVGRSFEEEPSAETSSIAASECYPPSEVSVAWSVTTAEGFDRWSVPNFSSAASEYEELQFIQAENDRFSAAVYGGAKRWGSGLLGCVSEKAVTVGPTQVWLGPERRRACAGDLAVQPNRVGGWRG